MKAISPHFVIIDDIDTMNISAQNAFLKLLEEPNQNIHFILTSHSPEQLLPTIRSRVASVHVAPISDDQSSELIRQLGIKDITKQRQLMYVAAGYPALISRLTSSAETFDRLSNHVGLSRRFIQGSAYERMAVVQTFKDDRQEALAFIDITLHLLKQTLKSNAQGTTMQLIGKLLDAKESIRANGNIRLQLMNSVV